MEITFLQFAVLVLQERLDFICLLFVLAVNLIWLNSIVVILVASKLVVRIFVVVARSVSNSTFSLLLLILLLLVAIFLI